MAYVVVGSAGMAESAARGSRDSDGSLLSSRGLAGSRSRAAVVCGSARINQALPTRQ